MRSFNFILLAGIVMAGCSKKTSAPATDCLRYAPANVVRIEKAAAGKDGATTVHFQVSGGCGQFNKFIEKNNGNTRTITVEAVYKGCMCTMDMPIRTTSYKFNEKKAGTYYLQFVSGENEFVTDTVVIK
ncbi:hypothetical protein [Chitinophaga agri]|uniref:Uncharacterized protein n=1 Tax=Chitinophaga agri TaxID=2703787 RepID=A0A6B9ZG91_9BACT|nr:hypothetical protein [Chitinophaga agri]QHS59593.1 hypothetical protein GWR21_08325 [Chitinophaga agri]